MKNKPLVIRSGAIARRRRSVAGRNRGKPRARRVEKPSVLLIFVSILLWLVGNIALLEGIGNVEVGVGNGPMPTALRVVVGLIFLAGTLTVLIKHYAFACQARFEWLTPWVLGFVACLVASTLHLALGFRGAPLSLTHPLAMVWAGIHAVAGLVLWGALEVIDHHSMTISPKTPL